MSNRFQAFVASRLKIRIHVVEFSMERFCDCVLHETDLSNYIALSNVNIRIGTARGVSKTDRIYILGVFVVILPRCGSAPEGG